MCSTLSGSKILFSVFGLIGILTMYSACRKQDREEVIVEKDLIQRAKMWYSTQIVAKEIKVLNEPVSVLSKTDDRRVFARMGKMERLLLWNDARVYKEDNLEYVIVPMSSTKSWQNQKYQGHRSMIFSTTLNGELSMQIVEMLSAKTATSLLDPISATRAIFRNQQGRTSDFNYGADLNAVVYDATYKQQRSVTYQQGRWQESKLELRNVKGSAGKQRPVSTVTTLSTCNCTDYYLIGYFYDLYTGQIVSAHILASYAICDGGSSGPQYGSAPDNVAYDECSNMQRELAQLEASSQETNSVSSYGDEYLDGITRTRLYEWVLRSGGGYKIVANLKGTHEKVKFSSDPNLQWVWKNLELLNIVRTGVVAVGTVEPSSDFFDWQYSSFIARAFLKYRVNYTVNCLGRPVSNVVAYESWGEFSAN